MSSYNIVVIGDFNCTKKIKKNNVKMLINDSRVEYRSSEIFYVDAIGAIDDVDHLDYDFICDLL
jgi:hypothetical protein